MKPEFNQQEIAEYRQRFITTDEERKQIANALENARLKKKLEASK